MKRNVGVQSPGLCQHACQTTSGCNYWTWEKSKRKACLLMTFYIRSEHCAPCVSGPKDCGKPPSPISSTNRCTWQITNWWKPQLKNCKEFQLGAPCSSFKKIPFSGVNLCGRCEKDCPWWTKGIVSNPKTRRKHDYVCKRNYAWVCTKPRNYLN